MSFNGYMPKRGLGFGDLIPCSLRRPPAGIAGLCLGPGDGRYFDEKMIWTFTVVGCVLVRGGE